MMVVVFIRRNLIYPDVSCVQRSHVIGAVQTGLTGPGPDWDAQLFIIFFALRM